MIINTQQLIAINECISQLEFWKTTNDITSSTHYCDISTEIKELELDDKFKEQLEDVLIELYFLIRRIK